MLSEAVTDHTICGTLVTFNKPFTFLNTFSVYLPNAKHRKKELSTWIPYAQASEFTELEYWFI
jgi:hypothetical protein